MTDSRIPSPERQSDLFRISVQDEAAGFFVLPQAIAWATAERDRAIKAETERDAARNAAAACGLGPNLVDQIEALRRRAEAAEASLDAAGRTLGAVILAALPLAPGEERVPGPEDERAAVQAVLGLVRERDAALHWEDVDDEWTAAADAAFPTRSGSHEEYGIAMQMVGNRHSKGSLVKLVNWLLVERGKLAKWIMACAPHAQSNLSCKQCEPVVGMFVVDGFECGWHLAQRITKGGT